jgi:hypothetical protein
MYVVFALFLLDGFVGVVRDQDIIPILLQLLGLALAATVKQEDAMPVMLGVALLGRTAGAVG